MFVFFLVLCYRFLAINGIRMKYTDEDLIEIGLSLADGTTSYQELLDWVRKHTITK